MTPEAEGPHLQDFFNQCLAVVMSGEGEKCLSISAVKVEFNADKSRDAFKYCRLILVTSQPDTRGRKVHYFEKMERKEK